MNSSEDTSVKDDEVLSLVGRNTKRRQDKKSKKELKNAYKIIEGLKKQLQESQNKTKDLELELEELRNTKICNARKHGICQEFEDLIHSLNIETLKRTFERKLVEKDMEMVRIETYWREKYQSLEDSKHNWSSDSEQDDFFKMYLLLVNWCYIILYTVIHFIPCLGLIPTENRGLS